MARYAIVSPSNEILEIREYDSVPLSVTESTTKPRLMPVVRAGDIHDPITHILDGPVYTVRATDVLEEFTARAKTTADIDGMRRVKIAALKAETFRRVEAVMDEQEQRLYACLGVDMARTNGLYANWPQAAKNVHDPLHTKWLVARGIFQTGIDKLNALRALTDPVAINAYDVTAGW